MHPRCQWVEEQELGIGQMRQAEYQPYHKLLLVSRMGS